MGATLQRYTTAYVSRYFSDYAPVLDACLSPLIQ